MLADAVVRGLVDVAIALYAAAVVARGRAPRTADACWAGAWTWTALHAAAAFVFVHHGDHALLLREAADRTEAAVGVRFGEGIYLNYFLLAVWGFDVAVRWARRRRPAFFPRWPALAVELFVAFMMFQATVVFGTGWIRWAGAIGTAALGVLLAVRRLRAVPAPAHAPGREAG